MKATLINIGTSQGVRIPSLLIKELNNPKEFNIEIQGDKLILNAIKNNRDGWSDKFKNVKNDLLINDDLDIDLLKDI